MKAWSRQVKQEEALESPRQSPSAQTCSGTTPTWAVAKRVADEEAFLGSVAAMRARFAWYVLLAAKLPECPQIGHGYTPAAGWNLDIISILLLQV